MDLPGEAGLSTYSPGDFNPAFICVFAAVVAVVVIVVGFVVE